MKSIPFFCLIISFLFLLNCEKKVEFSAWSVNTKPTVSKIYDDQFQGFYEGRSVELRCSPPYDISSFVANQVSSVFFVNGIILDGRFYFKINEKEALALQIFSDGSMGGKIYIETNEDDDPVYWLFFGQINGDSIRFYIAVGVDDIEDKTNCAAEPFFLHKTEAPIIDQYLSDIIFKNVQKLTGLQEKYRKRSNCDADTLEIQNSINQVLQFISNTADKVQIEYALLDFALFELERFYNIALKKNCPNQAESFRERLVDLIEDGQYASERVIIILRNKYNHLIYN